MKKSKETILAEMIEEMPFRLSSRIELYILEAMEVYANQSKWIIVEDKLPEGNIGTYIACLKNDAVMEMEYHPLGKRWWRIGVGDEAKENPVIKWQLLPEASK